jgi:hypothetical protein
LDLINRVSAPWFSLISTLSGFYSPTLYSGKSFFG